jgi:hypothetical protein
MVLSLLLCACGVKKEEITCKASTGNLGGNYASSDTTLNYQFENSELSKIIMTMDVSFSDDNTLTPEEKENSVKELLTDYQGFEHLEAAYEKLDADHFKISLDVDYKHLTKKELEKFSYTDKQVTDIEYLAETYEAQGYECE